MQTNTEKTALQLIVLSQKKVAEKPFKIDECRVDTRRNVCVISPNKGVAEIIGVVREYVVGGLIAKRPQILDRENGRSPRVTLAECVYLV